MVFSWILTHESRQRGFRFRRYGRFLKAFGKSPTLNVVEEHPAVVCDHPHVLLEYDVKLSPVGQL